MTLAPTAAVHIAPVTSAPFERDDEGKADAADFDVLDELMAADGV